MGGSDQLQISGSPPNCVGDQVDSGCPVDNAIGNPHPNPSPYLCVLEEG
jgi:hypothetical protein